MTPSPTKAGPLNPAFWQGYWITLRPYLFFVSGASGTVGLALAPGFALGPFSLAFASFFVSYGLGQATTDVFQMDTDALSSPYRPLVRGEISRHHVLAVSLIGLSLCGIALTVLNPWALVPALAGVAGLLTYTPFKRRWWGGPPYNAWIVALLPLMGWMACGGDARAISAESRIVVAMISVFGSYAVFVLLGYFKNVEADRSTGYRTLPVQAGRRVSLVVSLGFLALATVSSFRLVRLSLAMRPEPAMGAVSDRVGLALWITGLVALAWAHVAMARTHRDDEAGPPLEWVVRGYIAMHLGEAVIIRPELWWFALLLVALHEVALAARPSREQV